MGEHELDTVRDRFCLPRHDDARIRPVHDFARAARIRDDERRAAGQGLHPGIGQSFAGRGQHHRIGGGQDQRQEIVIDRAEEVSAIGQSQGLRQRAQIRFVLTLADQQHTRIGKRCQRFDDQPLPLAGDQSTDGHQQGGIIR